MAATRWSNGQNRRAGLVFGHNQTSPPWIGAGCLDHNMYNFIGEGRRQEEPALQPGFIWPWLRCGIQRCQPVCTHKQQQSEQSKAFFSLQILVQLTKIWVIDLSLPPFIMKRAHGKFIPSSHMPARCLCLYGQIYGMKLYLDFSHETARDRPSYVVSHTHLVCNCCSCSE